MFNRFKTIITDFGGQFIDGVFVTISLAIIGTVVGFIIALLFNIIRVQKVNPNDNTIVRWSKKISQGFIKVYVTIFRGTPMMVQAVIFYYSFYQMGIKWSAYVAGLFTISLNTAAYLTEVLRSGIESVDHGQYEAARSIGLGGFRTYLYVIFPQAIKNAFASIGNELIVNIKDSSVLSVITVVDLFAIADSAAGKYYWFVEAMLIAAAIYLFLTFVTSKLLLYIEKKLDIQTKDIVSSN
jgi:putative lysine transport system permease protein